LSESVSKVIRILDEQERRQSEVLNLSREIVRDSARAIKSIHSRELEEAEKILGELQEKVLRMKAMDKGFEQISDQCYQEFVEIKALQALLQRKEVPSWEECNVPFTSYLNGLADCSGELRRALQISLKDGKKEEAEYYFNRMNEIYEELMLVKYSSSLIGNLRRKQDVTRAQLEQARSEMLRN
jgi:translin